MSTRPTERSVGRILGTAAIILVVVTATIGPVAAHTGDDGVHHHDGWMGTHGGTNGWMIGGFGFLWAILWAVVLIGIPLAVGYLLLARGAPGDGAAEDALELLRRRYARGEIDGEEFEARRAKLLDEQT